ncbi:hypothetical protein [Spongiactinospora sp. TRM90649]|uniref:hypothetical protein n=1 Tax=Spongiactinospora sp. TRM90649 TaxID=3031114 RepID=UPI0023F913A5|nr:hypothetical protein [Spongiactinospora sp. TRM90649]MDF5752773.1 hypothetical protein [Spongiactinospora sp. TRM90649]
MKVLTKDALARAERHLLGTARLIDRFRFAAMFGDGPSEPVLAALRLYQNPDGGFGNALEPDLRGAGSQPEPVEVALWILSEVNALDDPMVPAACDYLARITTRDGGVPFVLPSVRETPRAPWWETPDDPPGSLVPTASIAGLLTAGGVENPWLAPATAFCWDRIAAIRETTPYEARAVVTFLERAADRERAEREFARLREAILATVTLDPGATGDAHLPLDFAPRPGGLPLFDADVLDRHLDALIEAQSPEGGWTFGWAAWAPATGPEWDGYITMARLATLRAYGRVSN